MANLASLKIAIDSGDILKAQKELEQLTTTSGKTQKATDGITSSFGALKTILASVGIVGLASEYAKTADAMNNLAARIKLVSSEGQDLHKTQADLLKIANENKVSLESVGKLYVKLSEPMRQLGANAQTTMDVTNAFSKALLVGGASTEEAASATTQFAQAMGSGVLRGDEFNSIAEASPRILKAVADSLGVATGKLREMAADGKLTAGIVSGALLRSMTELEAEAIAMPNTVSGAFQILKNNVSDMVYKFDEATGVSGELAGAINTLSDSTGGMTTKVIDSASALKQWIRDNQAGINTVKESTSSVVKFGLGVATLMTAEVLGNLSRGTKVIGEVGKVTGIVNEQGQSSTQIAEKNAIATKNKNATLAETLKLQKDLANLSLPDKEQKSIEVASKKSEAMGKLYKAYTSTGKSVTQVTDLMVAQDQLYDARIKKAEQLEKNSLSNEEKKAKKTAEEKKAAQEAKKAEQEAEKEVKRIAKLNEDLADLRLKNDSNANKQTQEDESKHYQDAILKREEQLKKFKGIKGAELEINKEFNIQVENLNKDLVAKETQLQISSSAEMYQIMNEVSGNWYANESINISTRAAAFAAAGQSDIDILNYISQATQAIDAKLATQSINEMNSSLNESKDLLSGFNDFGANLDGIAGKIGNVAKSISDMSKNSQKYINKDIEIQKKYAKAYLNAAGDVEKEKQAQYDLDLDSAKLTEEKLSSEMAGYASLAGTMASAFEKGSAGAIAFTALQSALGIASSWTAIAGAWALPFPANIPAVAAVTAAVMPIIAQLGGSSGGGSNTPPPPTASMGTVLGGGAYGQSESTTNIVKILEDAHASEYKELRSINRAVTSMAGAIEKTVANIFRGGALDTSGVQLSSSKGAAENFINKSYSAAGKFVDPFNLTGGIASGVVNSIGSVVGKVWGAVFGGSSKQSVAGSGFNIAGGALGDKASGNVGASTYVDVETAKKSFFGHASYSHNIITTALDEASSQSIYLIYKSFSDTMIAVNKGLGTDLGSSIAGYAVKAINISTAGLTGEEVVKKLNDTFSAMGDTMVNDIFGSILSQYQKLGEGLLETAVRVITEKEVVLQALGNIGKNISGDVIGISQSLVTLSGGLSNFQDSLAPYYDKFFTDAEKQVKLQAKLAESFKYLGVSMPTSISGFRSLVEGIDLSSTAGQEMFTQLMAISKGFSEFQDMLSNNVLPESIDGINNLLESIKSFVKELRGDIIANDTASSFATFSQSFNDMVSAIDSGASDVEKIGNKAIDNAKSYLATVTATASAGRDIAFAKAIIANKFESVALAPDITLGTINETLKFSMDENSAIVSALNNISSQLDYLNSLNTTQTATQVRTLSAVRATIPA